MPGFVHTRISVPGTSAPRAGDHWPQFSVRPGVHSGSSRLTPTPGRVSLALDGLQPDVGHEVLWVLRDCLSSEVLLARSLLPATRDDLADLLRAVKQTLGVPIVGVIADGQPSIRRAGATALPGVPHHWCCVDRSS